MNFKFFTHFRYAWTPACCKTCKQHAGWLFTTLKPELKPEMFWALIGKHLRLQEKDEKSESELRRADRESQKNESELNSLDSSILDFEI